MARKWRPADLREASTVTAAVSASGALARGCTLPVRPGEDDRSTRAGRVNAIVARGTHLLVSAPDQSSGCAGAHTIARRQPPDLIQPKDAARTTSQAIVYEP